MTPGFQLQDPLCCDKEREETRVWRVIRIQSGGSAGALEETGVPLVHCPFPAMVGVEFLAWASRAKS